MHIQKLKILTARFEQQITFYSEKIGLKLLSRDQHKAIFQIGKSELALIKSEHAKPYHFAINIPAYSEEQALSWLKQRLPILLDGEHEIQLFEDWNARAVYFYDEDNNIVEFIARRNLPHEELKAFTSDALLELSEIGMPVSDIKHTYQELATIVKLPIFDGGFERFCAIGDDHGLFICVNKNQKQWFPTGDTAYSSEFEIGFTEQGKHYQLIFKNEQLKSL